MTEITTKTELKRAIRQAKAVYACITFGTNEKYYRISKETALDLASNLPELCSDTDMGNYATFDGVELNLW